jgi:branched-chain amino acid transport system permease protein
MTITEKKALSIALLLVWLLPIVSQNQFLLHVMIMVFLYAILASSLNLTIGFVGELSLGHAAFFGIGAYTSAILSTKWGLPTPECLLLAGLFAGLLGLLVGGITLHLEGDYFVLITLSISEVLRLVAINWVEVTNGTLGFSNLSAPTLALGKWTLLVSSKTEFYYYALGLLTITVLCISAYARSKFRLGAIAVRENRSLAKSVGIDPFVQALITFVAGAFFAGLAGSFYAHYITFVGPEVFGFSFTVTIVMAVVVGGKGTVLGPILGAALVVVSLEYLRFIQEARLVMFGLLLMLMAMFFPNGIMGFVLEQSRSASRRAKFASIKSGV